MNWDLLFLEGSRACRRSYRIAFRGVDSFIGPIEAVSLLWVQGDPVRRRSARHLDGHRFPRVKGCKCKAEEPSDPAVRLMKSTETD